MEHRGNRPRPQNERDGWTPPPGLTRRRALGVLAGAAPLVATVGRAGRVAPAGASPVHGLRTTGPVRPGEPSTTARPTQAVPGIVKPLPPELFTVRGTNAETRWEALAGEGPAHPERPVLRPQPHVHADHRRRHLAAAGVRHRRPPAARARATTTCSPCPRDRPPPSIECAGNGRSFFADQQGQPAGGTAWRLGAVGCRPLARRPAVDPPPPGRACDARPSTCCRTAWTPRSSAAASTRATSAARCRSPRRWTTCCVAYEMNGEPLPPDHGFPARLVVPGWVGIASIKWLGSIEVADQPLTSPWNTHLVPDDRARLPAPTRRRSPPSR